MNVFRRVSVLWVLSVLFVFLPAAEGAEVPTGDVARAASAWVSRGCAMGKLPAGRAVAGVDELEDPASGARLRVVRFEGGGFVVLSSDDALEPVLAFSPTGTALEADEANPFWALLSGDIAAREAAAGIVRGGNVRATAADAGQSAMAAANRAKWESLLSGSGVKALDAVSDLRVDSFVESRWSQSTSDNYSGSTKTCFNYYTPNNYVCGCTATAIAQLMRHWQFPTASVAADTYPCEVDYDACDMTMMGGTYDWDAMPLAPRSLADDITEAQRQAIGKLCYDVGVTLEMSWRSGSSGASLYAGVACLPLDFGYANAKAVVFSGGLDLALLQQALVPNLDARCPCGLSVSGAGGHSVLVDGYGYSGGDFCIHLNMGWAGSDDAWYVPPDLETSSYAFNAVDGCLFNVFPARTGSIASGRVLDASGSPVAGAAVALWQGSATVATATTDGNGIYAFTASPGEYVAKAEKDGVSASLAISLGETTGTEIVTTAGSRGAYYPGTGKIGNTYGNDIVLTGLESVPEPVFSPESCLFYPSTNVVISCSDAGATIRYTLDGTTPDESSAPYTGPIFVEDTVTIKARAFAEGKNPSAVVGMTYTYDDAAGAPKGDYFANPIKISGADGSRVIEDNSDYTVEDGEPWHTLEDYSYYYQYRTAWYLWTAPGSGTMTFKTSCSGGGYVYPTYVAVYTGDALDSIERVAFSTSRDSDWVTTLSLEVEEGTTYRVVGMMGYDGSGTFTLEWSGELASARTPFQAWAAAHGISGGPSELTDGVANVFRYVFAVPSGELSPIEGISFDGAGRVVLALPPVANTDGVTLSVVSTADVADWSEAAVSREEAVVAADGTVTLSGADASRFYRLGAACDE